MNLLLDLRRIDDVRIGAVRPLITPALLQERVPAGELTLGLVEKSRAAIVEVLRGRDDRLVVVAGPCSIHDHDQALAYGSKLKAAADRHGPDLLIVMRAYFEKPRTTVGWKGYINDPRLDGSFAINEGLERARRLLIELTELGLPTGTEFLDLLSPQFIAELVAWGAIGARTTESQSHRQLASGLSCPIGFKNGTEGSVRVAADAILSARSPHAFMGMTKMGTAAIFETRGNEDCHVILRGGAEPNYGARHVDATCSMLREVGLPERVMIDCSHANSSKRHERQLAVVEDVAAQVASGDRRIVGAMLESHLEAGAQRFDPGVDDPAMLEWGRSITDACIGWADTEDVLNRLAGAVRQRRRCPATHPRPAGRLRAHSPSSP